MLNRQRREKPLVDKAIKGGERVVKPKFGVDEDICTGDHACMRLSGCPSLSVKSLDDPLRDDPVAAYRPDLRRLRQLRRGGGRGGALPVLLPRRRRPQSGPLGPLPRNACAARVIGFLQRRRESRRLNFADA